MNPGQYANTLNPSPSKSTFWHAVTIFSAALLARYCGALITCPTTEGSSRDTIEPAPLLTLTMRGVEVAFLRRGAKASPMSWGPVALVWKQTAICSARGTSGTREMPALLMRASRRPCVDSTVFAATRIDSGEETSTTMSSTVPGRLRAWRDSTAEEPLEAERLPRSTCLVGSTRSWDASSKPMPPLPISGGLVRGGFQVLGGACD